MPLVKESLQAPSQPCSRIFEVNDALRQHMFPCLGLRRIVHLAGTCTAWRQLIVDIPQHHLSEEARLAVLPSGLTSKLPLLQLVKQQGQLLAQLRGKHGFTPGIQRLSFLDDLPDGSRQGSAGGGRSAHMPQLRFQEILWSPCTCLEDASPWLVLNPESDCNCLPVVVAIGTGRQVSFQESPAPVRLLPHTASSLHAAWLTDKPDQILMFPSGGEEYCSRACLADARIQSLLPFRLPHARSDSFSRFFTVCDEEGAATDIFCWAGQSDWQDHISVLNASSKQLLYQFSCPEQLHEQLLLHIQREVTSHERQVFSRAVLQHCELECRHLLLAPNKKLLAVVWQASQRLLTRRHCIQCMGLSIHSAISGDLQQSKLLTTATSAVDHDCQPSWLSCSSNFMYVGNDGLLHLVTSSGRELCSNTPVNRNPNWLRFSAGHVIQTRLSASPCGRWILVMDCKDLRQDGSTADQAGHIAVVDASTGRTLTAYPTHWVGHLKGAWSMSGEVCLLERLDLVLVHCPQAHPTCPIFRHCVLLGGPASSPGYTMNSLSLSPCGSAVIDLSNKYWTGLQHWHIRPSSAIAEDPAAASPSMALQPSICAEINAEGPLKASHLREAWHPLHSARIYAISCSKGGVHIMDAKANRRVQSWSADELHGPTTSLDPAMGTMESPQADDTSCTDDSDAEDSDTEDSDTKDSDIEDYYYPDGHFDPGPHALSWSQDGCRLAVASRPSRTCAARCSVLHFSDRPHNIANLLYKNISACRKTFVSQVHGM